jgi:hypothetical protein
MGFNSGFKGLRVQSDGRKIFKLSKDTIVGFVWQTDRTWFTPDSAFDNIFTFQLGCFGIWKYSSRQGKKVSTEAQVDTCYFSLSLAFNWPLSLFLRQSCFLTYLHENNVKLLQSQRTFNRKPAGLHQLLRPKCSNVSQHAVLSIAWRCSEAEKCKKGDRAVSLILWCSLVVSDRALLSNRVLKRTIRLLRGPVIPTWA